MNQHCSICEEQTERMNVCQSCIDIEEFGYPSFPAYALLEDTLSETQMEKRILELVG
jgi:hypothetical protein